MKHRALCGVVCGAVLIAAAVVIALRPGRNEEKHSISFPAMGTVASLTLYTDAETFRKALDAVRSEFDKVERIASLHKADSALSRLNAGAARKAFVCSAEMWELLTEARRAFRLSEGAFDVSIAPLMVHWGFYRKRSAVPSQAETEKIKALTGLDKILFDDAGRRVKFPRAGFSLDLGGIAKGYAIDKAFQAVTETGIKRGVIDLGGNLRLLPLPPPGQKCYRIGIRRPGRKNGSVMPGILRLPGNRAVSSSGDYARFVELSGKRYGHIIDPATGIPAPGERAVTAVAPWGMTSDWLSTAVYLRGKKMARKLEKELDHTRFVIIEKGKF
jgi:thiamine biosynthesis lipoprotein